MCRGTHNPQISTTNGSSNKSSSTSQEQPPNPPTQTAQNLINTALSHPQPAKVCFLKTAVATVRTNNHSTPVNILLDEGAQCSFITESLADCLHLNSKRRECVVIAAFGAPEASNQTLPVATVHLETTEGTEIPISVLITPRIAQPLRNLPFTYVKQLSYLKDLRLNHAMSDNDNINTSMLIGADTYWSIVQETVIRGPGPTAVESKLGYLLSGPLYNYTTSMTFSVFHLSSVSLYDSPNVMPSGDVWETDLVQNKQSSTFLQEYLRDSVTCQSDGTYLVKFPWKPNHPVLPTNKFTCERRVWSLTHKLNSTPDMFKVYNRIMEEQLRRGFIEKVPDSELNKPCHYIPHHGVHKDSVTTPLRIVYDCSSREAKHLASLNDCLETGPPFLQQLPTIPIRFRGHKFGISADIEKALLHIQLHHNDRDFTHFLWPCCPGDPESPLQTYRFRVVLFGSASSPFMLHAALHCHLTQCSSTISKDLLQNLYVDNILSGCPTEEETVAYYTEARTALSEANFNLRSWASNSKQLRSIAEKDQVADSCEQINTLGLVWNTTNDNLSLAQKFFSTDQSSATKCEVLQQSSRVFDPLGFTAPVTISAKLLLQQLWQKKLPWDVPLPSEYQQQWQTILHDLQHLHTVSIPRCYWKNGMSIDAPVELHIFCDASTKAYGAVSYFRQGNITAFVIARNRVAPLKQLTLPRLELMGVTITAQMLTMITSSIQCQIDPTHMWCYSQIVLHWLNSNKKLQQFVSNRVSTITKVCPVQWWGYCPSAENPADLLTEALCILPPHRIMLEESKNSRSCLTSVRRLLDIWLFCREVISFRYVECWKLLTHNICALLSSLAVIGPVGLDPCDLTHSMILSTYAVTYNSLDNVLYLSMPMMSAIVEYLFTSWGSSTGSNNNTSTSAAVSWTCSMSVGYNTKFPYLLPATHRFTSLTVYATHATRLHGGTL